MSPDGRRIRRRRQSSIPLLFIVAFTCIVLIAIMVTTCVILARDLGTSGSAVQENIGHIYPSSPSILPPIPTGTTPNKFATSMELQTVAVLMTCYNCQSTLSKSIDSFQQQTYKHKKIYIFNDKSTDTSAELLKSYCSDSIIIISSPFHTLGTTATGSNILLDMVSEDVILFLDSDDMFSNANAITTVVNHMNAEEMDLLIFHHQVNGVTIKTCPTISLPYKIFSDENDIHQLVKCLPMAWLKAYSRRYLKENSIRWCELEFGFEDNCFHWSSIIKAKRVKIVDKSIIERNMNGSSTLKTNSLGIFLSHDSVFHYIAMHLIDSASPDESLKNLLFDFWYRLEWSANNVHGDFSRLVMCKRCHSLLYWMDRLNFDYEVIIKDRPLFKNKLEACLSKNVQCAEKDVCFVVPTKNNYSIILNTLKELMNIRVSKMIVVVDDNLDDNTKKQVEPLVNDELIYTTSYRHGAGRARNYGSMLCNSRYIFYADDDDLIDNICFEAEMIKCLHSSSDLHIFKYKSKFINNDTSVIKEMFQVDQREFTDKMHSHKTRAFRITAYPWTKMIKSEFYYDQAVLHGPSTVHNDAAYHWESIYKSRTITFADCAATIHIRNENSKKQLTMQSGPVRMEVTGVILYTARRLGTDFFNQFCGLYLAFADKIKTFAIGKLDAGLHKIFLDDYESAKRVIADTYSCGP